MRLIAMKLRACLVLVLVPLLLAGCGGADVGAAEPSVDRAAVRPAPADGVWYEAQAVGVLRADPVTGCLWIEAPDGTFELPLLLQGDSYRVDFDASPAAVLDGDTVVAKVGEQIDVGGGNADPAEAGVDGCPVTGHIFLGYFYDR